VADKFILTKDKETIETFFVKERDRLIEAGYVWANNPKETKPVKTEVVNKTVKVEEK